MTLLPLLRLATRPSPLNFLPRCSPAVAISSSSRLFSSSQPLSLREDKAQEPQEIEKAKQEQLQDGKRKQELESASETGVRADREKVSDHDSHMEKLQEETAKKHEEEHSKGKA